jgi:hypothetical protein
VDEFTGKGDFRVQQHTQVLLPIKHLGRWLLVIWDGETNRRSVLLFGELEFTEAHWRLIEALDSEINNCYKKHNIMVGKNKW